MISVFNTMVTKTFVRKGIDKSMMVVVAPQEGLKPTLK